MTRQEKNQRLNGGMECPVCGLHLIDLEHDGYEGEDENYHEYFCTNCNITFNVTVE